MLRTDNALHSGAGLLASTWPQKSSNQSNSGSSSAIAATISFQVSLTNGSFTGSETRNDLLPVIPSPKLPKLVLRAPVTGFGVDSGDRGDAGKVKAFDFDGLSVCCGRVVGEGRSARHIARERRRGDLGLPGGSWMGFTFEAPAWLVAGGLVSAPFSQASFKLRTGVKHDSSSPNAASTEGSARFSFAILSAGLSCASIGARRPLWEMRR
mmetsp:Transcript_20417/g.47622  ORF Transcript_20417/g.47622 Transcript_20417/m.47622 type:complete len:210 (+) Transcript_20417:700-1329(+)